MVQQGDTVYFGKYYQNSSDVKEPIVWDVLNSNSNNVLLLSKYVLDAKAYNSEKKDVTWETCSLRRWLNSEFFASAFSLKEQEFVVRKKIHTESNRNPLIVKLPIWMENENHLNRAVAGGNDTMDVVFLLSWEESKQYFKRRNDSDDIVEILRPLFTNYQDYNMKNVAIACHGVKSNPTKYAIAKGVYTPDENGGAWWWLRSPGNTSQMAAGTMGGDLLYRVGCEVNDDTFGIRPAIWVSKKAFMSADELKEFEKAKAIKAYEKLEIQSNVKSSMEQERNRRIQNNLCLHCGSEFKGFFVKKCTKCGIRKDY